MGASAYLAHGPLAGPTFAAAAAAGATLAFTSLHIPEDSPSGARAAATAIVSAAASSGLSVVADVSPNTARLLGDSPWEFLRSIGVARVRIDFGFTVPEILSIAAVLPIALNASTLRAADLAPFADLDVELIHNSYPREWTGLALSSVVVTLPRSSGSGSGRSSLATRSVEVQSATGCRPFSSTGTRRRSFQLWRSSMSAWTTCASGTRR
ncbi:MupG family TIM beta-alpha barrel fold protein [Curtobacterium flaccumfaciens]|uniref:MupG family TIM beta-alpha barrel fold protein n=1 Tax=Curtobacterium flaccumfaciens TaxID=2035 RepID=UPI003CF3D6DE